jgi:shikimate dehydrogenase
MTSSPTASEPTGASTTASGQPHVRLALIGGRIDRSLAPTFHTVAGQMLGLDVSYELIPRELSFSSQLNGLLVQLGQAGYRGVNITLPFKGAAARAAVELSKEVAVTGVANTLLLGPGGPTHAFNTDFSGFKWAYRRRFGPTAPGTVALLGAGGVGAATASALVDLGATAIRIFDILHDRSKALARSLRHGNGTVKVEVATSAEAAVDGVDGVANCSPVGMHFQPGTPVDLAKIRDQRWIFDAIYSPVDTELIIRATNAGLPSINGFELFLGQAIDAFEIFTGHRLTPTVLADLETRMRDVERQREF